MGELVRLMHSVHRSTLPQVLEAGLRAGSEYPDLGLEMRRGVVYCWLRQEDDKLSSHGQRGDSVYAEVTVDADRCTVAEMEFSSLAIMYLQGSGGRPKNPEASRLLAAAYRVTAVPLSQYAPQMFCTPEVLVKGDVAPEQIRVVPDNAS